MGYRNFNDPFVRRREIRAVWAVLAAYALFIVALVGSYFYMGGEW